MPPELLEGRAADTAALARLFAFDHLPPHLQEASRPFAALAEHMIRTLPDGFQLTMGLHLLVQSKDCAVRAKLTA